MALSMSRKVYTLFKAKTIEAGWKVFGERMITVVHMNIIVFQEYYIRGNSSHVSQPISKVTYKDWIRLWRAVNNSNNCWIQRNCRQVQTTTRLSSSRDRLPGYLHHGRTHEVGRCKQTQEEWSCWAAKIHWAVATTQSNRKSQTYGLWGDSGRDVPFS